MKTRHDGGPLTIFIHSKELHFMWALLKKILGSKSKVDYRELLNLGALIVDVRTESEYRTGHISGSVNLPLQNLPNQLMKLKKEQIVITSCASGVRSAQAQRILRRAGFNSVYNGGGWASLNRKINRN